MRKVLSWEEYLALFRSGIQCTFVWRDKGTEWPDRNFESASYITDAELKSKFLMWPNDYEIEVE